MGKKLHIVDRSALVRSVLLEVPATAVCGLIKVFTREDVETAATTDRQFCMSCLRANAADHQKHAVTIGKSAGWTALVEAEMKERVSRKQYGYTITATGGTNWTFPPTA